MLLLELCEGDWAIKKTSMMGYQTGKDDR